MQRSFLQPAFFKNLFCNAMAVALLMGSAAYGQSLGDIARENREQKGDGTSAPLPKVIRNNDLPKDPDAIQSATVVRPGPTAEDQREAQRFAEQRAAEQRAADEWKRQILAQKNKMINLQARIDLLRASIRMASGSVQSEGPFNGYPAHQLQRVAQIQEQLDEQKRKLDRMQDAARHAGMHTAVYDP